MKRTLLIAVIGIILTAQGAFALTGRQIMDKSDELKEPDSGYTEVEMTIKMGRGETTKKFKSYAKKYGDDTKILVAFTFPTRIKLLTYTYKGKEDDQWLYLSSGKKKRIVSADKGKAFVNSHFFYEDLQSRDLDDYNYKKLGDIKEKETGFECYRVESVKKKISSKVYDKAVMYVRKSDYFVVRIDFYKDGKLLKFLVNYNIKKIKGILTPKKVVMYQGNKGGETTLKVKTVKYNIPIRSSKFRKEALR